MANTIYEKQDFEKAFHYFKMFVPVKIKRELKEQFTEYISEKMREITNVWHYNIIPLKKSYKFQRLTR
jgi:hypothetical protein